MARKQYPPLAPEQVAWLRRWAGEHTAVLRRVTGAMAKRGFDAGEPTYRRAYAAMLELQSLASGRPPEGLWAAPCWTGTPPDFTPEQLAYVRGVAADAYRDLRRVTEYFDRAGAPDRRLAEAIRTAADRAGAIGVNVHYLLDRVSGAEVHPVVPADPAIDCGAGI